MTLIYYSLLLIIGVFTQLYRITLSKREYKSNRSDNFYIGIGVIYSMIVGIGIMSTQWLLFILLILISLPMHYWILKNIMSSLAIGLIVFIIINKYHLHINFYNLIF